MAQRTAVLKRKAEHVIAGLSAEYPDAKCALEYATPFQLLIATILSAQCTDVMVNKVTKILFAKYPDTASLAKAKLPAVEAIVRPTGFYKNKAKNIVACAQGLIARHEGKVPRTLNELVVLPGVGRKTANVVLGNAFDISSGVVVDTHVRRLTNLIGLTRQQDPEKIERELAKLVPREQWTMFSHWLIHHGRKVCIARRPKCGECVIRQYCDFGSKEMI